MSNMICFLRATLLAVILVTGSSWGFLVHQTVGQLSIYELPREMRPFFYKNMDYLLKEIIQPDIRRNKDSLEAPRHFIDLERYGDSAAWKMPLHWTDALRAYGRDSLVKYGYVPYQVLMTKDLLTKAFRSGNKDSILFYAADLGHYIGDAHVPLHTTINYDGQLSGQKGIHNLWETTIPELEISHYRLYSGHTARYLGNPAMAIWEAIRHAHGLLPDLLAQEREASRGFTDSTKYSVQKRNGREFKMYSAAFALNYNQRLGNTIQEQLRHSANLIADFWYTCWKDAGEPDLDPLLGGDWSKKEKKALKQERRVYRQDDLWQKNLLWTVQHRNPPAR